MRVECMRNSSLFPEPFPLQGHYPSNQLRNLWETSVSSHGGPVKRKKRRNFQQYIVSAVAVVDLYVSKGSRLSLSCELFNFSSCEAHSKTTLFGGWPKFQGH